MDYKKDDWVVVVNVAHLDASNLGQVLRVIEIVPGVSLPIECVGETDIDFPLAVDEIRHATPVEILEARLKYGI